MSLTPKQAQFVREYLVDLNATQAAIRAGYSSATAGSVGHENLNKPEIAEAIAKAQGERAERTEITADMVLQELWAIATANPNELIEWRRGCCRFCWGEAGRYQETQGERERREASWQKGVTSAKDDEPVEEFDALGGIGFDARRDPNPDCTECFGQGAGEPFVKDTRQLSDHAMRLYAGVKVTKDGIEVKMHDKASALVNVGKHLGMFVDKVEHTGGVTLVMQDMDEKL